MAKDTEPLGLSSFPGLQRALSLLKIDGLEQSPTLVCKSGLSGHSRTPSQGLTLLWI